MRCTGARRRSLLLFLGRSPAPALARAHWNGTKNEEPKTRELLTIGVAAVADKSVAHIQKIGSGTGQTRRMPDLKIITVESVTSWNYSSWNRIW